MTKTVYGISPDAVFASQHGAYGAYVGYGLSYVFDVMKRATGKNLKFRLGAGAYNDHNPTEVIQKSVELSVQIPMLPPYVTCKFAKLRICRLLLLANRRPPWHLKDPSILHADVLI